MKTRLPALIAAALLLALPAGYCQHTTLGDGLKASVLRADEARLYAMLTADTGALDDLLTADCLYIHSYGRTQTKAELLAALKSSDLKYKSIQYTAAPQVRLLGSETAVLTGTVQLEVSAKDGKVLKPTLLVTAVYVLLADRWQLASYQSTNAAPPAR